MRKTTQIAISAAFIILLHVLPPCGGAGGAFAQITWPENYTKPGWVYQGIRGRDYLIPKVAADSASLPTYPLLWTNGTRRDSSRGALAWTIAENKLWKWNGTAWSSVGGTGSGSSTDTTSLSNRINLKLNIADTANMLLPYRHWTQGYLKSADIAGKLNISDTATMLAPYALSSEVPAQFNPIAGANIGVTGTYPNITFTGTVTQYTDALARAAISLTTTGSSGAATYNNTTGVLNVPQYSGGGGGTPGGGTYSIQYNRAGAFAGRSTFVFDTLNARVGIGTASPAVPLDVQFSAPSGNNIARFTNTLSVGQTNFSVINNVGLGGSLSTYGSGFGSGLANNTYISATNNLIVGSSGGSGGGGIYNVQFRPGGFDATAERLRMTNTGMMIGNAINADPTAGWWLHARSNESNALRLALQNTNSTRFSQLSIYNNDATLVTGLYGCNSGFGGVSTIQPLWATLLSTYTNGLALTAEGGSGVIKFITGGPNFTTNERMRIESDGDVGIGTASPAASSILDINSTTRGFLPPRMTTVERNLIASPATGLIIFCTDCTATDGSTGVSQTYSSSTWKNHY